MFLRLFLPVFYLQAGGTCLSTTPELR